MVYAQRLRQSVCGGWLRDLQRVHAAERKGIHSFLHEGMMFPSVREKFLDGGGFCLHHFWMAKAIEEYAWQTGGFGIAILCSDLASLAGSGLADPSRASPD